MSLLTYPNLLARLHEIIRSYLPIKCQVKRRGITQEIIDLCGVHGIIYEIEFQESMPVVKIASASFGEILELINSKEICKQWLRKLERFIPPNARICPLNGIGVHSRLLNHDISLATLFCPFRLRKILKTRSVTRLNQFIIQWEPRLQSHLRVPPSSVPMQVMEIPSIETCAYCLCQVSDDAEIFVFEQHPSESPICTDCVRNYVLSCFRNRPFQIPIRCVQNTRVGEPSCSYEMFDQDLRNLLSNDEYQEYLTVSLQVARQRDLLSGIIVEMICPNCAFTMEYDRSQQGIPLLLWCPCGEQWCTGCRTVILEHHYLNQEEIELMHTICRRRELHLKAQTVLDIGKANESLSIFQSKNIAILMEETIHLFSPHCPLCNIRLFKDNNCNLVKCSICSVTICFVCSKLLPSDVTRYLYLQRYHPLLVGHMMHLDDQGPITIFDQELSGVMHQYRAHEDGPHVHLPDDPSTVGRLCPHNNTEYWHDFRLEPYRNAASALHAEEECTKVFLNQCLLRALRNVYQKVGKQRFLQGMEYFPHREDALIKNYVSQMISSS